VHIHHNTIYNCGQTAAYAGVSSCTFQLLFENNVVDSCAFGAFSMPKGIDTKSGFVLRLRNNIFSNSPADTAVIHRRSSTQKLYLENNCFFNNLLDYNTATSVAGNIPVTRSSPIPRPMITTSSPFTDAGPPPAG
jgi:hypothetical protein